MNSVYAFPAGIFIAAVVSSVGISGGKLWMPFLLLVVGLPPEEAVGTSLLIQTAGMASASVAYAREKAADSRLSLALFFISLPGIAAGVLFSRHVTVSGMKLILGTFMVATSLWFVWSRETGSSDTDKKPPLYRALSRLWLALPLSVGCGLLSTGMGEWLIPIMRSRLGMAMRTAIATCVLTAFGSCLAATILHLLQGGLPSLSIAAWAVPGVLLGAQIGPRLTSRINERLMKEVFIFVLALVGIHLIYHSI